MYFSCVLLWLLNGGIIGQQHISGEKPYWDTIGPDDTLAPWHQNHLPLGIAATLADKVRIGETCYRPLVISNQEFPNAMPGEYAVTKPGTSSPPSSAVVELGVACPLIPESHLDSKSRPGYRLARAGVTSEHWTFESWYLWKGRVYTGASMTIDASGNVVGTIFRGYRGMEDEQLTIIGHIMNHFKRLRL